MSRALNKQILFDTEQDFLYFLKILQDVKKTDKFSLYAYCLMSNHYHLIIRERNISISKIMNKINSRYANYYNMKNGRTGYVFNDRFHSESIENIKYLMTCIRYIHQNPIKAGICNKTYEYKFSSIHSYRNKKGNYLDLVDIKPVLKHCDSIDFAKWNEEINYDRCLDIMNNKMSDEEVTRILYKIMNVQTKKEYLKKSEAEKVYAIFKLIDLSIPLQQLSRVTGFYYNKLQKMRIGKIGNVTKLTYKP